MLGLQTLKRRSVLRLFGASIVVSLILFGSLHVLFSTGDFSFHGRTSAIYHYSSRPLQHPNPNLKAAFVTFTKGNQESLEKLRYTIRDLEDRFNRDHGYPYIVFTNEQLTEEFKELVASLTRNNIAFEYLDKSYYGYPEFIDMNKAKQAQIDMKDIIFGTSDDYRFQARFMAGLIFRHPAIAELDYYWRFEIGTKYLSSVDFDPFEYMKEHGKKLSFSFALYEYHDTIPSLYSTVQRYIGDHPGQVIHRTEQDNLWSFIVDSDSSDYNNCHFWSNFQVADLSFFKGTEYQDFFDYIDHSGGIFYERWGDPVIHTMAAVLYLRKSQVHHWESIGYQVADSFIHCPNNKSVWQSGVCRPISNFDNQGYSCLPRFIQ
ncbi:nucleotide-diphospho-sugar transferase [Halteromyces radiatus]|uniref:nucleotide-diphospho-sugar transferase n=1 Tax=Halteromyces radiatus TaxID=101107 RepID=UPI00221E3FB3|nr:nucleotide-diphospho-sugar transferase [Halteromyces radiatus]KAI8096791.1 nucleotide-diphospho-sugar transferase [Halteromyces radiatus]